MHLEYDSANTGARYASQRLSATLASRNYQVSDTAQRDTFRIRFSLQRGMSAEAFDVAPRRGSLVITASDSRGLIYGALSVAESLAHGTALERLKPRRETPTMRFRAIKFNLPWDSYRSSSALDLHYETVRDVKYWEAFLDMMADNRFNALTLWNLHPFPYMIRAKNFPEASRFTEAELAEWRQLYRSIFQMAKARGIETYVINWNILVSPEFAKAHALKGRNFFPNYKGEGDTSELIKRYTRESVTQVLEEYPDLTGLGVTLGEQMGGLTPRERQAWIDETIMAGIRAAKRPTSLIFRAPLSADLGQGGSTSLATEQLTRRAIEGSQDVTVPVWLEIKFNWSHGHSTPTLVKTHGGPLNDAYFNPPPSNYKVAWTVRNEDFFALRWGGLNFIRQHIRQNGHQSYVGGYIIGSENYIPAKDYFTKIEGPVKWRYAFERQWLFYMLWGRLLYSPATPDRIFADEFVRRYGKSARPLLSAYEAASATQLEFAKSIDFTWDFTLYGEGMMVAGRRGMEPISVERLIRQKPLLANRLSVEDYVARRNTALGSGIVTPLEVAARLERNSRRAIDLVRTIDTSRDASLMYEVADVKAWSYLGLFFAEKLRAAVALQTFRVSGAKTLKTRAVDHLERSVAYWDELVGLTEPVYRDMPLAHYNPPDNRRNDDNLFHWKRLRAAVAKDVTAARDAAYDAKTTPLSAAAPEP